MSVCQRFNAQRGRVFGHTRHDPATCAPGTWPPCASMDQASSAPTCLVGLIHNNARDGKAPGSTARTGGPNCERDRRCNARRCRRRMRDERPGHGCRAPAPDGSAADGVHLLWTAPPGAGGSLDGWAIRRRKVSDRPKVQCSQLADSELEALHRFLRLQTSVALFRVREGACPQPPPAVPAAALEPFGTVPGVVCVAYEIDLPERHRVLEVDVGTVAALAIALRDGKAVAVRLLTSPAGVQASLTGGGRVWRDRSCVGSFHARLSRFRRGCS